MSLSGSQTDDFVKLGDAEDAPREEALTGAFPQPLDLGRLLDEGLIGLRRRVLVLPLLAGVALFLGTAAVNALRFAARESSPLSTVLAWSLFVVVAWVFIALTGAAAGLWFPGSTPSRAGLGGFARALPVSFVVAFLAVLVGTPIVPFGLRLWYRWSHAPVAAAQEGLGPIAALRSSWRMTARSKRFTAWIQTLASGGLLAALPLVLGGVLNGDEASRVLSDLANVDFSTARAVLRPLSFVLFGAGVALPAALMGRGQIDLLVRRRAPDLFTRLAERFPEGRR